MEITDLLTALSKYGVAGVIIGVLMVVIVTLYGQLLKNLRDANARADKYEAEVRELNTAMQQYLSVGFAVKQAMNAATQEMRDSQ